MKIELNLEQEIQGMLYNKPLVQSLTITRLLYALSYAEEKGIDWFAFNAYLWDVPEYNSVRVNDTILSDVYDFYNYFYK